MNSYLQQKLKFIDDKKLNDLNKLIKIMELLRDPEDGCAWDLKQTFSSIAPFTIEEAYEVSQAIQDENFDELKEELGDLLLHIIFQAELLSEKKDYNIQNSIDNVCKKLIDRHPHIFSNKNNKDWKVGNWELTKQKEKNRKKVYYQTST